MHESRLNRDLVPDWEKLRYIDREFENPSVVFLLIENKEQVVGQIKLHRKAGKIYLSEAYIKPEFRGKGYMSKLYSYVERVARQSGIKILRLTTVKGNERADKFWAKQGFRVVKEGRYHRFWEKEL